MKNQAVFVGKEHSYTYRESSLKVESKIVMEAVSQKKNRCLIVAFSIDKMEYQKMKIFQESLETINHPNILKSIEKPFKATMPFINNGNSEYLLIPYPYHRTTLDSYLSNKTRKQMLDCFFQLIDLAIYCQTNKLLQPKWDPEQIWIQKKQIKILPPHLQLQQIYIPGKTTEGKKQQYFTGSKNSKQTCWRVLGQLFYKLFLSFRGLNQQKIFIKQIMNKPNYWTSKQFLIVDYYLRELFIRMLNQQRQGLANSQIVLKIIEALKNQGQVYCLPLIEAEQIEYKNLQRVSQNIQKQKKDSKAEDKQYRVVMQGQNMLSLLYKLKDPINPSLTIRILFKKQYTQFIKFKYTYDQLPKPIKRKFGSLWLLSKELSLVEKSKIRLLTNGVLQFEINENEQVEITMPNLQL